MDSKKIKKTTKSARKFTHQSFKERLDSLSINNTTRSLDRKLKTEIEDDSFFYAESLSHWREINISKNFTEYCRETHTFVNSLPQLLYHKKEVFSKLKEFIDLHDNLSLEPLLDLLVNFVHDLGEEFMEFYQDAMTSLINLSLAISSTNENDTTTNQLMSNDNVIQWCFTSIAFIFKHLSKTLAKDLIPTLNIFYPCLTSIKKQHIIRFTSEAISFLFKKSSEKSLSSSIDFLQSKLDQVEEGSEELIAVKNSIVIMLSDSVKNVSNSFHSKALNNTLKLVLQKSVNSSHVSSRLVTVYCDLVLVLLRHGTADNVSIIYEISIGHLNTLINEGDISFFNKEENIIAMLEILSTLAFSEAGKKCTKWAIFETVTKDLVKRIQQQQYKVSVYEMVAYYFTITLRNAPMDYLAKFHSFIFNSMLSLDGGRWFMGFVESSLIVQKEKLLIFGSKITSDFIIKNWQNNQKQISSFLSHINPDVISNGRPSNGSSGNKLVVTITPAFYNDLIQGLKDISEKEVFNDTVLLDVYWRLLLLTYSKNFTDYKVLLTLFTKLLKGEQEASPFAVELCGNILQSLSRQQLSDDDRHLILETVYESFNYTELAEAEWVLSDNNAFLKSSTFLAGFLEFLISLPLSSEKSIDFVSLRSQQIITVLTSALVLPSHNTRSSALRCIAMVSTKAGKDVSDLVNKVQTIEDLPLTLQNGRDLALKVRQLAAQYAKEDTIERDVEQVVIRWLFGFLSNKFKPVWDVMFESAGKFISKSEQEIWNLINYFLFYDYAKSDSGLLSDVEVDSFDTSDIEFELLDHRISDSFRYFDGTFSNYFNLDKYFVEHAVEQSTDASHSSFMRYQSLNLLLKAPSLGEKKARYLVPALLSDDEATEVYGDDVEATQKDARALNWNIKETNMLVELFGKFKNIKNIYKSQEVYQHGLELLCSKSASTQKAALQVILAYKVAGIRKFSDNLNNIIDDSTFKDELVTFFADNQAEDLNEVMSVILRILFGKAKVRATGNSKQTKKNSIMKLLTRLPENYVIEFLQLGFERINYGHIFNDYKQLKAENAAVSQSSLLSNINITQRLMRELNGFTHLLSDVVNEFKAKFPKALEYALSPLIYSLSVAQYAVNSLSTTENDILVKTSKSVRQIGLRNLSSLFTLLQSENIPEDDDFSWVSYKDIIYDLIVKPRLDKFSSENLQSPSSLMRLIISWSKSPELNEFLYTDNYQSVRSLLELFENPNCKNAVISEIIDFCVNIVDSASIDEKMETIFELVNQSCLIALPQVINEVKLTKDVFYKVVSLILLLLEKDSIKGDKNSKIFIDTLVSALDKSSTGKTQNLDVRTKTIMMEAVSKLYKETTVAHFADVKTVYTICSKSLRLYPDAKLRSVLVDVFIAIGEKLNEFTEVAVLLGQLNSVSTKRIGEPDFEQRIDAYNVINESKYKELSSIQWLPIVYNGLFYMNDPEVAIRSNSRLVLSRFVDCTSLQSSQEEVFPYIHTLKDIILPNLRVGIRHDDSRVQKEYVSLLAHVIEHSKYYTELSDMKVLFFGDDEEANFFLNINHIQVHRISRAVRRLAGLAPQISANNIFHYLIPIVERYVYCSNENLRNLSNDSIDAIGILVRYVTWNQYKAVVKRFVSYLKHKAAFFRDVVHLVVSTTKALQVSIKCRDAIATDGEEEAGVVNHDKAVIRGLTQLQDEIDSFIISNLFPQLSQVLGTRDEDTAVYRVSISEAMISLILCLSEDTRAAELPAVLTKVSQVLRSRSEELRDSVRKSLGKITVTLGTKYIRFVIKELKSALRLGPQLHILSFTVHYLLVCLDGKLDHGDLDECADLIMDIIMEDVFGAAAQEKDAEGYSSKTKEVKHNKSFDTAEILSRYISLSEFNLLLRPIKLLLSETISLRTQNRLDELLRRFSLGLNHNEESSSKLALMLCYEIFTDSKELLSKYKKSSKNAPTESEQYFLIQLDAKPIKTQMEFSQYSNTLRKFSLELLRVILSHNESLVTFGNLKGFIPLMERSLKSDNEGLLIASLKVLNIVLLLPMDEDAQKILSVCARRVLQIFRNCPTTNSDLAQSCLRFLSSIVRHKNDEIDLKTSAISYILTKLLPDLEDPNRQGLAFNFLKAVLSQHIMAPEVYDVMEKVSKIMVTNHAREVRNMARSSYFQFLMEYDQGKGKLEKEFSSLIGNLSYPAESGRLSAMELIKSIMIKATPELLNKISASFFVALSNIAVTDDSLKCRESAAGILSDMMKKLGPEKNHANEAYLISWIKQSSNSLLLRCGLQIYKLYLGAVGLDVNAQLDQLFMSRLNSILEAERDEDEDNEEGEWELIYAALSAFTKIVSIKKDGAVKDKQFEKIWRHIISLLLYPHSWIRLSASRLVGILLSNVQAASFLDQYDIQTIAYRLARQLNAPKITPVLGNQIVKNLVFIVMYWNKNDTAYIVKKAKDDVSEDEEDENNEEEIEEGKATQKRSFDFAVEWLVSKIGAITRNDYRSYDFVNSKKSAIKLAAMVVQVLSVEKLQMAQVAEPIMLSLFNYTEEDQIDPEDKDKLELHELTAECLKILEGKLGLSEYTRMFAKVRKIVADRRVERKVKRSQMKVTNPEAAAKRKLRKHSRVREKRKFAKDDSGYYHGKKKQRV